MTEGFVSRTAIFAALMWFGTGALLGLAWLAGLVLAQWDAALLLGMTASVLACIAVVLHVRCYAVRLGSLIRITSGLEREEPQLRVAR